MQLRKPLQRKHNLKTWTTWKWNWWPTVCAMNDEHLRNYSSNVIYRRNVNPLTLIGLGAATLTWCHNKWCQAVPNSRPWMYIKFRISFDRKVYQLRTIWIFFWIVKELEQYLFFLNFQRKQLPLLVTTELCNKCNNWYFSPTAIAKYENKMWELQPHVNHDKFIIPSQTEFFTNLFYYFSTPSLPWHSF